MSIILHSVSLLNASNGERSDKMWGKFGGNLKKQKTKKKRSAFPKNKINISNDLFLYCWFPLCLWFRKITWKAIDIILTWMEPGCSGTWEGKNMLQHFHCSFQNKEVGIKSFKLWRSIWNLGCSPKPNFWKTNIQMRVKCLCKMTYWQLWKRNISCDPQSKKGNWQWKLPRTTLSVLFSQGEISPVATH